MEEALVTQNDGKRGGWRTFPFIIGGIIGPGASTSGVMSNMVVYLINEFNVSTIDATQIISVASGCNCLAPIIGAIAADSCFGCFAVVSVTSAAFLLGMVQFTLTATLPSLKPPPCSPLGPCQPPTPAHLAVLYTAMALTAVGVGGTRFNIGSLGVSQHDGAGDQDTFLNWYFVALYASAIAGQIVIVYVEDTAGWAYGFALCAALTAASLLLFLHGHRYLRRHPKPKFDDHVEEELELMGLVRLLPLLLSSLIVSASISILSSLSILQALSMDRRLGAAVIPAGSITVVTLAASVVCISLLDRVIYPTWEWLTGRAAMPLQRIGVGYVLNTVAAAVAAAVESRRLAAAHGGEGRLSVMWLVPALALMGAGEALHFPGQVAFYYAEFPVALRSTAMGMLAVTGGLGFYLSTAAVAAARRMTGWLHDDVDESRLDCVYWVLGVVGVVNFGFFLVSALVYKKNGRVEV